MVFSRARREIQIPPHFTPDRPEAETTHLEKDPFNKQLIDPINHTDTRPLALKRRMPVLEPEYNTLYGTGRSEGDWRYFVDNYAVGTLTTSANATVTTAVTLTLAPNWRLSQWPAAINLYLCIRKFSMAPQSAITTVGAIDVQYNDLIGGQLIPMGDFVSSSSIAYDVDTIIPTPITDPGITAVGNLLVKLSGTTPTTSVYNWQIAFSGVYLLPSLEGYGRESIRRVLPPVGNDL